ncbi:WD40-repeat-containing domain protein [Naviculisporaceae sp. PSN 640]
MQSSDPRHFFETDAEQQKRARRAAKSSNKYGNPIQLKSKILAAVVDPVCPDSSILVAESTGTVRRVNIKTEDKSLTSVTTALYRGPTTPVACVAVDGGSTVFAGAWDKTIWSWDLETKSPGRKYVGHSDFVKAIVCGTISGKHVLISGGADKKIIVWDIQTGARLHTLQDSLVNMLSIQDLLIDHAASTAEELVLISASSDPHIRRWKVRLDGWEQVVEPDPSVPGTERRTIVEHETTVYKLALPHPGEEDDAEEVDLWTSSGDGTAKCLSRLRGFAVDDTYHHGDHVRAVAVTREWVITAGRDENVKFWNRTSGELHCTLEGHFDEVTDLVVLRGVNGQEGPVVSVSIDGTVRTWPLATAELDALVKEQKKADDEEDEAEGGKNGGPASMLTADEEAELAALMEEDED